MKHHLEDKQRIDESKELLAKLMKQITGYRPAVILDVFGASLASMAVQSNTPIDVLLDLVRSHYTSMQ